MGKQPNWFSIRQELSPNRRLLLTTCSFLFPIFIWCALSYVPWLWHPKMRIQDGGDVRYFRVEQLVDKDVFHAENAKMMEAGKAIAVGTPANPVYLPAPHEVVSSFYTAFTSPPKRRGEPWLHESLLHSVYVIFWGFTLSSIFGVPLGILCGAYPFFSRLHEPFIEFFRYLPAPAFGALAVAVVGIHDPPKIAIIFIGTFFQQVLIIANTTRTLDRSLIEAAQTLGARNIRLLTKVVIPGILPELYRDMRILLGWAWTYLIVAEIVGTSTGITWFINQQGKYRIYDNVFAAIIMIGIIGLSTDLILAWLGKHLFPWTARKRSKLSIFLYRLFGPVNQTVFLK